MADRRNRVARWLNGVAGVQVAAFGEAHSGSAPGMAARQVRDAMAVPSAFDAFEYAP